MLDYIVYYFLLVDEWLKQFNSRELQNLQHYIGGFYHILLISTGAFVGSGNFGMSIIFAILTFLSGRISVELQYRVQLEVIKERFKQEKLNK